MKSASLPSLRVDPALREAAEGVLQEGETLSSFVEHSVRAQVQQRQQQEAFIARGLASRDSAKASNQYIDAKDVLAELQSQLDQARKGSASVGFSVRFTQEARDDLARRYDWLLQRAEGDFTVAERALQAIGDGVTVLEVAP